MMKMSSNPSWWIFFGCSELLFGPLSWIFDSQPIANLIQLQCFLWWASILDDFSNPCSPIHVEKKLPSTLSLILRNKSERNVSWRRLSLYSVLIRQKSQRWIYFFLSWGTGGMSLYVLSIWKYSLRQSSFSFLILSFVETEWLRMFSLFCFWIQLTT